MRKFFLLILILIVALTSPWERAQAQQSTNDSELREKAFTVLESLAGELNTLQSAENRARIGANLAESLWKHDETRARALFQLVQDEIKSRLVAPEDVQDGKQMQTFLVFLKLRSDTLDRIGKYDAELAFSFFKATEVDLEKVPHYLVEQERNLDVRLSQKVAAKNPDVALRFARLALERGFSDELLNALAQLNRKHKDQAQVLYKEIIAKLRRTEIKDDWPARNFVFSLGRIFQPPAIDELAFRDFVGYLVTTAAANGCDAKTLNDEQAEFCKWTSLVLANAGKFDARVARLKRWTPEGNEYGMEEVPQAHREFEETAADGTVDDLLALAEKYPNLADEIYWRAMFKAREAGDLKLMRKIAEDYKGNPERREELLKDVARAERSLVVDEEELQKLQALLNETPGLENRIRLLTSAAYRAGRSNRKMALKLLNQAERIADTMSPGKQQCEYSILLAAMYSLENDERGFTIMESIVPKLNSLVDSAVKLDGFDTSYLREGEWNMSAGGSVGELLTHLSDTAQLFAWNDFDRAMSLAAQFERPEIRMMAQLKLAQGILAGPHKRELIYDGY